MFTNDSDHLDQHFLIDQQVINDFIDFCNLKDTDTIIEVGPGNGVITEKLCQKAKTALPRLRRNNRGRTAF